MLKASWEALLWSPRGIINVIKGFPIMNLAAALISPANASEVFPEAPRPLVSASSKELHPLSSFLSSLKKEGHATGVQAFVPRDPRAPRGPLCVQGTRDEGDSRHRGTDCTQGPCLCFLGAGGAGAGHISGFLLSAFKPSSLFSKGGPVCN